jgi:hypothetical protein
VPELGDVQHALSAPLAPLARDLPGSATRWLKAGMPLDGLTRACSCRCGVLNERVHGGPGIARRSRSRSAVPVANRLCNRYEVAILCCATD